MAWRVPRFGVRHSLRDAGAASVSVENTVGDGDFKAFLHDERREVMAFSASETDHHVQVDLGTGYASVAVDRFVIPVGHNYNGYKFRIRESASSDLSGATLLYAVDPHSGTGQIDEDFLQASVLRHIRLDWVGEDNAWSTPEWWMTLTLAPSESAEPTWVDQRFYNVQTWITPAGDRGDLQLGASQRVFELTFPNVYAAANIAMLDQLIDIGPEQAFLFWPPFDDEDVLICKMDRPPERRFSYPAPANGTKGYTYRFSIIEQLV